MLQRPPAGTIPDAPGSYQFKDREGRVIYVGKAKSLRSASRTTSRSREASPRAPRRWSPTAESVEWIQVRNDVEALMLEYSLIQQHKPRFNVRLRDDKSYPFLAVTLDDEWPRPMVMRGRKRKGVRYFGPYGARLRDPRDARPAAAHVSGADVQRQQARSPPAPGPAVPALPHREVQRSVRR